MPPTRRLAGGSRRVHLVEEPDDQLRKHRSAGVLRDQQTLNQTTGNHGHLLLSGLLSAGDAFGGVQNPKVRRCHHITAIRTLEH